MDEQKGSEELGGEGRRVLSILKSHPLLYRLALAWPDLEKAACTAVPGDLWAGVSFSFQEWSSLADVAPQETIKGFDRLRAYGIILPDGTLHPAADMFFGAALKAAFKVGGRGKPKEPEKDKPKPEGE